MINRTLFFSLSVFFSFLLLNYGAPALISLAENINTIVNINYFYENKKKILNIAKNKDFKICESNDDISVVFVNNEPKIAYIYQTINLFFYRKELLLISFDDGVCLFCIKSKENHHMSRPFFEQMLDFADSKSRIKKSNLSTINKKCNKNSKQMNEIMYLTFRRDFKKIIFSQGFKEIYIIVDHVL